MNLLNRWARAVALCGVAGVVTACGDAHQADIKARAHAWVDRLRDTTKVDTLALENADSVWVDSVGAGFTTDDWLYFWHEVEEEQARRAK